MTGYCSITPKETCFVSLIWEEGKIKYSIEHILLETKT